MYREFYGLAERPFALLPDPRFMYLSGSHQEALAHLLYGIESGEGFIKLVGQVGTGKTTLCRTLLDRLGPDVSVAFIFNPSQTELELLQAIHRELGLSPEGKGRSRLVEELNEFLLKARAANRRVVLLIDEAQNLPRDVLEQLRLLSNLETEREKLLQIVLIGQPELDQSLMRPDLRQLHQRITVSWEVRPLDLNETGEYVQHRLRVAGRQRGSPLFSRAGLYALYRASKGTPRVINAIADRALLAGYALGKTQLGPRVVARAVREMSSSSRPARSFKLAGGALLAAGALGGALWLGNYFDEAGPLGYSAVARRSAALGAERTAPAPKPPPPVRPTLPPAPPAKPPAAPPPPAPPPQQEAPQAGALSPALLERSAGQSAAQALRGVLSLWGVRADVPMSLDPSGLVGAVERVSDLRAVGDFTSFPEILALNHPLILELEPRSGERRYAVMQMVVQDDLVGLLAGDEVFVVEVEELERLWSGRVFHVWRNFAGWPMLAPGDRSESVRDVQGALGRLGYLGAGESAGEFDARTESALRRFQGDRGLARTGQLGFKTMISIYDALDEKARREGGTEPYGGPRLQRPAARSSA